MIFKDLFKPKIKHKLMHKDLLNKIDKLLYEENLNEKVFNISNKLYLINVHYEDVNSYLNNFFTKNNKVSIICVSIDKFFKNFYGYMDLYDFLRRVKNILLENKEINKEILDDLEEILDSLLFILNLS